MIDKSIEYKDIVMVMNGETALSTAVPTLPSGFSFRFFTDEEDIAHWARIEASVDEFDNEEQARTHFIKEFGDNLTALTQRCVFVINPSGIPVATAMGWFGNTHSQPTNRLHWIAVCPQAQGIGLGKAVSQMAVQVCASLSPGEDVWLSTQTWSHRAVLMYNKLGFVMAKTKLGLEKDVYVADFEDAIKVLGKVLPAEDVARLADTAV